ncbi:MAG: 4Fe-4S binding protein [Chloroflexi bacterium]|nr:4Fe-4S binding protein [Chloroflexota bacterium]
MAHIVIDKEKCTGCGICVNSCGQNNLVLDEMGKAEVSDASNCIFCRECLSCCPSDAISMDQGK